MSDAFTNLLAALLGAIVGGLLTLAGSVLVNRWELRRTARFRIYEELLPRVMNETWPLLRWHGNHPEQFEESMDTLQRASIVLGPREWVATFITQLNAHMYLENATSKADSDGEEQERKRELEAIAEQIDKDLEELDGIIEMQIKRMWGPRWWLRRLLHRGEKAAASRRATPN